MTTTTKDNVQKISNYPETRTSPLALDDYYIKEYEQDPTATQHTLLKRAYKSANVTGNATRQQACIIHTRVQQELEKRLIIVANSARTLGLQTLVAICKDEDQPANVRATVATTLTKTLFPDAIVVKELSTEDMKTELEALRLKRLEQE